MKAQVKNVMIRRAEGVIGLDSFEPFNFPTLEAAQAHLNKIAFTAPEPATGTYDKTDFVIEWVDGETYSGRYDLQKGGLDDSGDNLREHVINFLQFMAGEMKPDHMTDAQYKNYLRPDNMESAKQFLAKYEL
jgi:hypothetical protein